MVEMEYEGRKYEQNEVAYGLILQAKETATIFDPVADRYRLSNAVFTREVILRLFTLDGKPCDINNAQQISPKHGNWLDIKCREYLSALQVGNISGEQEKTSPALQSGKTSEQA